MRIPVLYLFIALLLLPVTGIRAEEDPATVAKRAQLASNPSRVTGMPSREWPWQARMRSPTS